MSYAVKYVYFKLYLIRMDSYCCFTYIDKPYKEIKAILCKLVDLIGMMNN